MSSVYEQRPTKPAHPLFSLALLAPGPELKHPQAPPKTLPYECPEGVYPETIRPVGTARSTGRRLEQDRFVGRKGKNRSFVQGQALTTYCSSPPLLSIENLVPPDWKFWCGGYSGRSPRSPGVFSGTHPHTILSTAIGWNPGISRSRWASGRRRKSRGSMSTKPRGGIVRRDPAQGRSRTAVERLRRL